MKKPSASLPLAAVLVATLSLTIAACASAAAPSSPPTASPPASATPPASSDPDTGASGPSDPGAGGNSGNGDSTIVIPQPGTINPHPVAVEKIEPSIDGRHVTVKLTWTSGVAPCYVLDSVIVSGDGNDIVLSVVEGSADANAICIEIAQTKSTIVDLGELEPGEYTITVTNSQIPPVTITVA